MTALAQGPLGGLITDPAAPFPGNRFAGASWRPDAGTEIVSRLRALVQGWAIVEGPGWIVASEKPGALARTEGLALALGGEHVFDREASALSDPQTVAAGLVRRGANALDGLAPPFRALWADTAAGAVHARTDVFGLGHIFTATADGFAMIASSAALVGDVIRARASAEALAAFAVFGTFLAEETPFSGVTRLAAGASVTLADGRLSTTVRPAEATPGANACEALREAVRSMVRAAPDAELELSGGLDSRIILAALPPELRQHRSAITVGVAGEPSDDLIVAQSIASAEGLDWKALDAGRLAALDADGLNDLLCRSVIGYDYMANPLEKVSLIAAGAGRSVRARFGGQNGEILRGYYYPGQPLDGPPSEALARRLISWRLGVNDRVDDAILAPALRKELRADAEDRVVRLLMSQGGSWPETLDSFYVRQRMQVWAGNSASNRLISHQPLYPFLDPAFVSAALAMPASEKLNSRAAYRLLLRLDTALARRPLADGAVPAMVDASAASRRLQNVWLDAHRLSKHLRRRLKGRARTTLGSQSAAEHWRRLQLFKRLPLERLARTGFFDASSLERLGGGQWLPDRPTLGFVLMVAAMETRG